MFATFCIDICFFSGVGKANTDCFPQEVYSSGLSRCLKAMSRMCQAHLLPPCLRHPEILLAVGISLHGLPEMPPQPEVPVDTCEEGQLRKRGRPKKDEQRFVSGDGPRQSQRRQVRAAEHGLKVGIQFGFGNAWSFNPCLIRAHFPKNVGFLSSTAAFTG